MRATYIEKLDEFSVEFEDGRERCYPRAEFECIVRQFEITIMESDPNLVSQ